MRKGVAFACVRGSDSHSQAMMHGRPLGCDVIFYRMGYNTSSRQLVMKLEAGLELQKSCSIMRRNDQECLWMPASGDRKYFRSWYPWGMAGEREPGMAAGARRVSSSSVTSHSQSRQKRTFTALQEPYEVRRSICMFQLLKVHWQLCGAPACHEATYLQDDH